MNEKRMVVDSSLYNDKVCRLLGMFMACGHLTLTDTSVFIKPECVDVIKSFIPKKYIVNDVVWQHEPKIIRIFWKSTSEFPIDRQMIYGSNGDKRVQDEVLNLPNNKLLLVLKGFIEGNGVEVISNYLLRISSETLYNNIRTMCDTLKIPYFIRMLQNVHVLTYDANAVPIEKQCNIYLVNIDNKFI